MGVGECHREVFGRYVQNGLLALYPVPHAGDEGASFAVDGWPVGAALKLFERAAKGGGFYLSAVDEGADEGR